MDITIEVPDELAEILRRTPEELRYDLRLRALAGLVERGLLSSGRAAELAGVSRREFLDWCGRWHVRLHRWDDRDVEHDVAFSPGRSAPVIVCPNTSPLDVLARLEQLDLLGDPGDIRLTRAVRDEIRDKQDEVAERVAGLTAAMPPVVDPPPSDRIDPVRALGPGERSVLSYALTAGPGVLCVLDDAAARAEARRLAGAEPDHGPGHASSTFRFAFRFSAFDFLKS